MTQRRQVVVRPELFDRLDQLLPPVRGATGRPSTADFILHDLTGIVDTLADEFEASTMASPETDTRVLVTTGMTVAYIAIYVKLRPDDVVEVLSIDLSDD